MTLQEQVAAIRDRIEHNAPYGSSLFLMHEITGILCIEHTPVFTSVYISVDPYTSTWITWDLCTPEEVMYIYSQL